jgi:Ig-like domain-containing protein
MSKVIGILLAFSLFLAACNLPAQGAGAPPSSTSPGNAASSSSSQAVPPAESVIAPAQKLLAPQTAYIPSPPITTIPSKTENIFGTSYLVYHTDPDPFRLVCPAAGCGLDERLIDAIYAGAKVRLQKLVRMAGVDVVDGLRPVDIHLVRDGVCTRSTGEWGSAGSYPGHARDSSVICLYADETGTFLQTGAFGAVQVDPYNPLTPETAIRLGGAGVIGHEYAHVLFFNRHQLSPEEYVNTLDYASTLGAADPAYLDLCEPRHRSSEGPLYDLCAQLGFTLADFRQSLIDLDRLERGGFGETSGVTSVNQHRAVIQALIGKDPYGIFQAAGYPVPAGAATVYQLPYANEACTDRAELVQDVTVPDGTLFDVNAAFQKTWRIRNTGTCTWNGYQLAFVGQEAMTAAQAISVPVISANAEVDLTVPMTAPPTPGVHVGQWRLRKPDGTFFGPIINTTIFTRPGCSAPPQISFLKATPDTVGRGAMVLLEWGQVTNADGLEIAPGVGEVDLNGGRLLIQPKETTTFTMTAACASQTAQQQVTVTLDPNLPPFEVTEVTAQASPADYKGACAQPDGSGKRIDFAATIKVSGPGVLLYKWDRSDKAISKPLMVVVDAGQPAVITTYWQLWASYQGYEAFHLLGPTEVPAKQAKFTLTCSP